MGPRSSVGLCETYLQAQEFGRSYVLYSCRSKGNAGTHFDISRRARNCSRFRSVDAHDEQKNAQMNWILCEDPGTPQWFLRPLAKCKQTRKSTSIYSRSWPLRDCAISRRNACCSIVWKRLLFYRLEKLCEDHGYSYEWVSGQKPRLAKKVKTFICKILMFPG